MLDRTLLDMAIRQVDEVSPSAWFALSRVHPDVAAGADGLARPGRDGIPALGGCCGTDGRHLRALGGLLTW
jgi:hypothetical protein